MACLKPLKLSNNKHFDHLVIFDGECLLCNKSVLFLLKKDTQKLFRFCTLKYALNSGILDQTNSLPDSVVYIKNDIINTESDAVLQLCKTLGKPYSWLYIFNLIPKFLRDIPYRWVSKSRYSIWGKTESCGLLSPENRARLIDENK